MQLYLNLVQQFCTRVHSSVFRFVSQRKGWLSLPRQTSSSILSPQRGWRGKGKIYWRAVSFFTELYWPVSSSSSRFPFLLAGFSRAFLLSSRCLTRFPALLSSPRSWRRVHCLVEISPILTRIDSTRERRREELRLVRGLKLFWFSL